MVRLLALVTGVALVLFAYENPARVDVYFVRWGWDGIPIWGPVTGAVIVVFAALFLVTLGARHRAQVAIRHMRAAEEQYEAMVADHSMAVAELQLEAERLRQQGAIRDSLLRTG